MKAKKIFKQNLAKLDSIIKRNLIVTWSQANSKVLSSSLFIFIFTHNQLEINHSACRNKDCE